MSSCASVYMCFVVTCWERADLLALVCGVYCEFVTFPFVSWVRCGTWLYRFLIFAPLLTLFLNMTAIISFCLFLKGPVLSCTNNSLQKKEQSKFGKMFDIQHSTFKFWMSNIEYQTKSNIQIECRISNIKLNPTFKSNVEYQTQSHIQIFNVEYRISN